MPRSLLNDGQILLYGDVGDPWGWGDGFTPADVALSLTEHGAGDITVRINSGGGAAFDGIAIFSLLKAHAGEVTTVVDGIAASAASLIFMAGAKREMRDGSMLMIHDASGVTFGTAADHERTGAVLDKLSAQYAGIYAAAAGIEIEAARTQMLAETWMSADEAVAGSFATDKIADTAKATASFDYRIYAHAPAGLPSRTKPASAPAQPTAAAVTPGEKHMSVRDKVPAVPTAEGNETETKVKEWAHQAYQIAARAGLDLKTSNELVAAAESLDAFKDAVLDRAFEASKETLPARNGGQNVVIIADGTDKFRAGVVQAVLAQSGIEARDAKNEFNGIRPMDIIREVAAHAGLKLASRDPMKLVAAVITHSGSDFSQITSNIAEKSMLKGYEETPETFEQWTSTGSLPDFKIARAVDLNMLPSLPIVPESAEYTYMSTGERGEVYSLATAGGLFSISRQAIINDDLSVFSKIPQRLGRAAKRTIGNDVYALLAATGPTMGDGVALFNAAHNNYFTGGASALSATSLQAADIAMGKQTDRSQNAVVLNLKPKYLIIPRALKYTAGPLLRSSSIDANNPAKINPVQNLVDTIIDEVRLDKQSATAWYLAADQNVTDTVEVLYLNGVQQPVLEEHQTVTVDGIFYKIRLDYGVKAFAWEGISKNVGV